MQTFRKSPFNYIGGKYKLLPQLLPLFPKDAETFVDLFAGGLAEEIKTNRRSKAEIMQTFFLNKVLLPEDINVSHNLLIPTTA